MGKIRNLLPVFVLAVAAALTRGASAAEAEQRQVVYNEATKSYFELRNDISGWATQWPGADASARRQVYHGVRGRLAVLTDRESMEFVRNRFEIRHDTWIGARYFCGFHKLIWVTGKVHQRSDYSRWAGQWHRTQIRCPNVNWMPVYLRSYGADLYWQASGPNKGFNYYLVEYPTGRP